MRIHHSPLLAESVLSSRVNQQGLELSATFMKTEEQLVMLNRRQCLVIPGLLASTAKAFPQTSVEEYIRHSAEQAPLQMQFKGTTAAECRLWQQEFAAALGRLLGPYDPPRRWETHTVSVTELKDHTRHSLVLRAPGHPDLPVYLLRPHAAAGKRAGILALHGHGEFGNDSIVGIASTPERQRSIATANYDYGLQLVRRGYVVAAPCLTPFGVRLGDRKGYGGQDPCAVTFIRLQLLGKVLMAENLRDALWSLELLAQQPDVDRNRLGCVGLSYGGRMTMLTAALSPRVRLAVISGALNLMQERVRGKYSCGAQVIPGLLRIGDVPEIASLIAPRPCLWEVGLKDSLMVREWIDPALERMRRAYKAFNALKNLKVDYFDGGHRWNGTRAYPLLEQILS